MIIHRIMNPFQRLGNAVLKVFKDAYRFPPSESPAGKDDPINQVLSSLAQEKKSVLDLSKDYECGVAISDAEILTLVERYGYPNQEMKDSAISHIKGFLFPQARVVHLDAIARCFAAGPMH